MGWDSNPNSNQNGKRVRDTKDAVYLDNYHAHKRYLSEVMASSLNGLTVGDSLSENSRMSPSRFDPMESPARTEIVNFSREELAAQDSPMSEDNDDCVGYRMIRYSDSPHHISLSQSDRIVGSPTSPVSPQRNQKIVNSAGSQLGCSTFSSSAGIVSSSAGIASSSMQYMASYPLQCAQTRQRNSDSDSRFPPSPSDPCQSADLRRAALLRSLQMRAQPPDHSEYSFGSPAHGIFSAQAIRSSGRVRSLLLDDCTLSIDLSTHSQDEGNIMSETKTGDLASQAKQT